VVYEEADWPFPVPVAWRERRLRLVGRARLSARRWTYKEEPGRVGARRRWPDG
jgi:hypothetical protein